MKLRGKLGYAGLHLALLLSVANTATAQGASCGTAPVARLDVVFLDETRDATNGRYSVVLPLLMNDTSTSGEPLSLGPIDSPSPYPQGGTIRRESDGTVFFEGDVGEVGTRLFEYRVNDSGQTATGTVWVFEGGVTVPLYDATDDAFPVSSGTEWTPLDVLANDLVAPSHSAVISTFQARTLQNGWVQALASATGPILQYRPPSAAYSGPDEFTYTGQVSDALDSAVVRLTVQPTSRVICWIVTRRPGMTPLDLLIDTSCSNPTLFRERCFHFGDEANPNAEDCAAPNTFDAPFAFAHSYPAVGEYELRGHFKTYVPPDSHRTQILRIADAPPVPRITVGDCIRTTCQLSAWLSSDNEAIVSYSWSFGDGSPLAHQRDVTHDFVSLGDFTVILVVTDSAGQTEAITRTVSLVDRPPTAQFTFNCSATVPHCSFTSTSTDDFWTIASHEWRWKNLATGAAGVLSTTNTAQLSSSLPGTYEVTLTVTDSHGQAGSLPQTITLSGALTAAPDWVALPSSSSGIVFDPRINDFGPGAPFVIESVETPRYGTVQIIGSGLQYTTFGGRPVEADRFGYTLRNALNQRAQGVIRVVSRPVAETGRIAAATAASQPVKFAGTYLEPPLVFLSPATSNEPDWARPRLLSVTASDFTLRLEEPNGPPYDGLHGLESVDFLAVLPEWNDDAHQMGAGQLEGGLHYAAGRTFITYPPSPELPILRRRISLPPSLTAAGQKPPIILAEIQPPGPYFGITPGLTIRVDELTRDSFSLRLEAPEGSVPSDESIEVAWLAVEGIAGRGADAYFEAVTVPSVTDNWNRIDFRQPYAAPPVFLAGFQSHDDSDPAILRQQALTAESVEIRAQEDLLADSETSHGAESVGYLAFEAVGAIFGGAPRDLWFAVPGEYALTAGDDSATVDAGDSVRIFVLDNDLAGDGLLSIAWLTTAPQHGTVEILPGGQVLYQTADREYTGSDNFGYIVTDSTGTSAEARVFIEITGGR
jgi:PKD repeat protein